MKSRAVIFARVRFGVIACVALFGCSQAIALDRKALVSSKTDVTGGTVVKNDGLSLSIKELETDVLRRFFFIPPRFDVDGSRTETSIVVNGQDLRLAEVREKAVKVGMRAKIVYYTEPRKRLDGERDTHVYMQSVRAISKPTQ